MTRKKSNVKALALAVTCAILAGGYSGLNPVYAAADTLYKDDSKNVTTASTSSPSISNEKITELEIAGVLIGTKTATDGSTTAQAGRIEAKNIKVSNYLTVGTQLTVPKIVGLSSITSSTGTVSVNGAAFASDGAITATSLKLNGMENDVKTAIEAKAAKTDVETNKNDITTLKQTIGDANSGLVKKVTDNEASIATNAAEIAKKANQTDLEAANGKITALEGKTTNLSPDGKKLTDMDEVGATTLKAGGKEITAEKVDKYDAAVKNTAKITYDATDGTTIDGNVMVNKGGSNQVKITDEGIVVGLNSTVIGSDGVYAGGHTEATAKAVLGADGSIKGAGDGTGKYKFTVDDATGNTTVGGTLGVTGAATLGSTLEVTGTTTLKDELQVDKKATFGTVAGSQTVINGGDITADGNVTAKGGLSAANGKFTVNETSGLVTFGNNAGNQSTIAGKTATFGLDTGDQTVINGGAITAKSLTVDSFGAATITANDTLKVGTDVSLDKDGNLDLGTNTLTDAQLGNINNTIKAGQVIEANSGKIGGVKFSTTGEISDVKNITAEKGTIGQVGLEGGKITANNGGTIAGVSFATGGVVSGVSDFTSTIIRDGAGTIITNGNVESKTAKIGAISIDNEKIEGSSANGLTIENVKIKDGVVSDVTSLTADKATIGGVNKFDNNGIKVDTGSTIQVGVNTKIEDGSIAVSTNTTLTDQALTLNTTNTWTAAGGLVADKATVNGVTIGETAGKAVFNNAGKSTTIDGDTIQTGKITADELLIDKISLGKDGSSNISIDKDGHVQTKGNITITDAAGNVMSKLSQDQATFGNAADNQTTINKGKLNAKAKNTAGQQAEFNFDENGLTVSGLNAAGATSSFGFNAANGIGTFTDKDATTTAINGSAITSTNGGATGVLDGSNLTLTNGANSTALTAGGATFTGAAGEKGGTTTTINGGTITTDTLNVERINLGEDILDSNGTPHGSNLSMDKQGNFSAAGGNFTVKGGTGTDKGAFTNKVGNTTLQTDTTGASMKYNNGTVESNVSVGDDSAKISAGASSIEVKNDGITNTGVTTFKGAVDSSVPTTETTINGNTIKTGHLITDKLTITGSGAAAGTGSGSIAFGGDGSITSNIKDAATGKEATFKTDETGTFTEAKDIDGNKTTNTVNAKGNTNVVTDGTNTSTATQTATSIGGVVTNGTVTMRQELTTDGMKVSVDSDPANYTQITNKDVSITDPKNAGKRINLSDLGQLNDLDGELTARDEYNDNKTAVGAINAEAAIRREEVARLDNRIDDVNNRVDKVGAMAAAIASLKSIGYDPQAPSEFSIGLGQYKGETGVAMGFFHYPNKNFMINVSLSTAGGETMGGIGATWRFGHKSPQKLLDEQREAQARKELAAAEKYQAAAKLAKEAQERAEYAAKLARQAQVSADNAKAAADATQAKHFQ